MSENVFVLLFEFEVRLRFVFLHFDKWRANTYKHLTSTVRGIGGTRKRGLGYTLSICLSVRGVWKENERDT